MLHDDDITRRLRAMSDTKYRDFQAALIPTVPSGRFIGVRTPQLRALAREMLRQGTAVDFLRKPLPHGTFDEMQLHAFIISALKGFDEALRETECFLPYVDNWATCDQLSPRAFRGAGRGLLPALRRWMRSPHEYTARFGIGMLMQHFLDAPHFRTEYLDAVAAIRREEYYVRMMQAWYFATALAKQYAAALPFIAGRRLDPWTHRKAIQKACESRRLAPAQKEELRALK